MNEQNTTIKDDVDDDDDDEGEKSKNYTIVWT